MYISHNFKWKCSVCGKELDAHYEEESYLSAIPPKCSECGGYMVGEPTTHQNPPFQNPFRKD
jgi:NAD-dependent SIR2 family protein deacetylase